MARDTGASRPDQGSDAICVHRKSTNALADATAYLSQRYCGHQLETVPGQHGLNFHHSAVDLGRSAFNLLQYGSEVSVASTFEDFYMLEMPLEGGVDIEFGNERFQTRSGIALLLSPGPRFVSHWRIGTRQLMLQIHKELVHARMAELARRTSTSLPVFNPIVDLRSNFGRHVQCSLGRLANAVAQFDGLAVVEFETLVPSMIDEMLRNVAFRQGSSIVLERLHATPRQVKLAIDLFQARHGERLCMPEVAREIGISERSLFDGFQRHYQRSPLAVLTDIRMEHARHLIRTGLTAAEAARRVGINHYGRFASTYKRAFGVLPSQERP